MADSKTLLEPERFYHVYNHAVGNENLFKSDHNYLYFLELLKKYIIKFVDIYAYCLMPNHFHFVLKIKCENDILFAYNKNYSTMVQNQSHNSTRVLNPRRVDTHSTSLIISKQFSNLFNSYAQAFNKENDRKGSLFVNRFKRRLVADKNYLIKLIHYIHYNPVMANLTKTVGDWKFSSYNIINNDNFTLINSEQVIKLFDNKQNFIYCHKTEPKISGID